MKNPRKLHTADSYNEATQFVCSKQGDPNTLDILLINGCCFKHME
jgi:hypothetical protein